MREIKPDFEENWEFESLFESKLLASFGNFSLSEFLNEDFLIVTLTASVLLDALAA